MTPRPSISRSVLSEQVKDHLLKAIIDGGYPPGARIVETRVARELGTSQAPVREALRDLEALGVVESTAFRGARVRRPSIDELLEAFIIRTELESLGARLAIPRMTDQDFAGLESLVAAMRTAADAGDAHAEAAADAAFHARVVDLSGNETLRRVWRTLEPHSRTFITLAAPGMDRRQVAEEHQPILDALRTRDPQLAADTYRHHFAVTEARLRSAWGSDGPIDSEVAANGAPPAAERPPDPDGSGTSRSSSPRSTRPVRRGHEPRTAGAAGTHHRSRQPQPAVEPVADPGVETPTRPS
jgi:DNA-binding GntR family transcriptional regulator